MAALTEKQQAFLVTSLACCVRPKTIIAEAKQQWGVDITASQVSYYDPTNAQGGQQLSQQWQSLFWKTREAYLRREGSIPIALRVYRLELLQEMLDHPMVANFPTIRQGVLEQAAKEVGGLFQRPITAEEVSRHVADLIGHVNGALEKHVPDPEQRAHVQAELKQVLEGEGAGGGP